MKLHYKLDHNIMVSYDQKLKISKTYFQLQLTEDL